jgi:hypothetical protein
MWFVALAAVVSLTAMTGVASAADMVTNLVPAAM